MARILGPLAGAVVFFGAASAEAFNTGNHFEATRRGLEDAGFSATAIDAAKVANYEVDFVVNLPPANPLSAIFHGIPNAINMTRWYHFDSLYGPKEVQRELAGIQRA